MYVRVTSKGQITIPHEVRNQHLIISPTANMDKLQNLKKRKHAIKGDPEDLVTITWDKEMNIDLPYHHGTSGVERQYPLNKRPNHFNTL